VAASVFTILINGVLLRFVPDWIAARGQGAEAKNA